MADPNAKGRKKGESFIRILGFLDDKTRLASDKNCFMIQEKLIIKDEEVWRSIYYYSDIKYAFKGYLKHIIRQKGKKKFKKPVEDLVDLIMELEKKVEKIGDILLKNLENK